MDPKQQTAISDCVSKGQILFDEPLSRHTSYGIGGPAEAFFLPGDNKELARMLRIVSQEAIPVTVMGSGSNCLVSDTGVPGIVISLADCLNNFHIDGSSVTAGAGVTLGYLVNRCLQAGLVGVENLVGVPGTVGGALIMNARAFGGEISTHVDRVRTLTLDGKERIYRREDLQFGYRSSGFRPDEIILEAEFHLKAGPPETIADLQQRFLNERKARQPLKQRSAGSVFKNPASDLTAGMLIDKAGLKGTKRGDAEISVKHGNFFVNYGKATAEDIAFLIKLATRTVRQQFGTQLELEIRTLGFQPGYWEDEGLAG
ncbi:MAG: UDP-N-acetylmuramate dehydrogenase [Fidelibacterota bacterium]|nr:MAG: UDP-N-acetylmuramate dehydrogenase [Candidatus Neomarinimicrobiota bacterium]